jgi:hypothetical protein
MNRKDRIYMNQVKQILKESKASADRDFEITGDVDSAQYYAGMSDAFAFAHELIRKIK